MSTISTVAVDFIANVAKYLQGLEQANTATKKWSNDTKKQTKNAEDAFDGASKALDRFAKQIISFQALQKLGSYFTQAAKDVSVLVDEAQKVGATADEFEVLSRAAAKNGATIDDVKRSYIEVQKSINEAKKGTKETVSAFDQLGLAYTLLEKLTPTERFYKIVDALNTITDANKRAELGTILLGKSYNELNPVIALGSQRIKEIGSGGLTAEQKQKVDQVTKSFEQLNLTLKNEIQKSLATIAEYLTSVAKAATYVIENFGNIAKLTVIAFSPFILVKFGEKLLDLSNSLLDIVKYIEGLKKAGDILGGITVFTSLADVIKEKLAPALAALIPILRNLGLAFAAVAISVSKFLIAIAILPIVMIAASEAMSIVLRVTADMFELFQGKTSETAAGLREYAKNYNKFSDDVVGAIKLVLGFEEENIKLVEATTETQRKLAARQRDASKAANEQAMAFQKLQQEGEALGKVLDELSKKTEESTRTSFEKARDEFIKLVQALDRGPLSFEAFKRRVAEIAKTLDAVDLERLRIEFGDGPFSVLAEEINGAILAAKRFAQEEVFGKGTAFQLPGGGLPKGMKPFETTPFQEATKKETERVRSLAEEIKKESMTAEQVYAQRVTDINKAAAATDEYGLSIITVEEQTIALTEAQKEFQKYLDETWKKNNPEILKAFEYMSDFADQFSRAIAEGKSFGDALSNVFKNILRDITALILRTTILQGIMAAIGFISPTSGAAQIFGKMTGIIPSGNRAEGGPVSMGNAVRIGERGPETFVPSTNGYILPNDMAPNESINVTQNIYVQTGVAQTVRAEMFGLLPRFKQEAMAGVLDAKQRGGSYAKGLAGA
jgi:hypothetical protein